MFNNTNAEYYIKHSTINSLLIFVVDIYLYWLMMVDNLEL